MGNDYPLVTFTHCGEEIYSQPLSVLPQARDFIQINIRQPDGTLRRSRWLVHLVEWIVRFEPDNGGEMRPEVDVHLKRLTQHQWDNRNEPTGYSYLYPYETLDPSQE